MSGDREFFRLAPNYSPEPISIEDARYLLAAVDNVLGRYVQVKKPKTKEKP